MLITLSRTELFERCFGSGSAGVGSAGLGESKNLLPPLIFQQKSAQWNQRYFTLFTIIDITGECLFLQCLQTSLFYLQHDMMLITLSDIFLGVA